VEFNIWMACYLALGTLGGLLAGLLGIGGGMIMVPFMVMLFQAQGHPYETLMQVALATSMATIMFTAISSMRAHHKLGNVRWDLVKLMVPGMLIGCFLGATVLSKMPTRAAKIFFACFMFYSSIRMLRSANSAVEATPMPTGAPLYGFSTFVGIISTMVGAGGAFMTVPYMNAHGVNGRQAIGTSSAFGFPLALFGTIGYVWNGWSVPNLPGPHIGFVFVPALIGFAVASVLAAPLGAKLAQRMPVSTLKRVFAVLLMVLAARVMWMAFR
jgi:uncharacterized protein